MKPAMFHEMTHVLGAPPGWNAEKRGECLGLPVAFNSEAGTITSCWCLEPEEVLALMGGARVYLTIVGNAQPPVSLAVRIETRWMGSGS